MTQDYAAAFAYVSALAGDPNSAVLDFRAIHDADKTVAAIPRRGTLPEVWQEMCAWNNAGYGIFACINAMDGNGRELANVAHIRTHAVDLDNLSAPQNYQRTLQWQPAPSFAVQSSPNKFHVYWTVEPYVSNDFYQLQQRKLRQLFDGDRTIIDPTRVLRVPGFYHMKQPSTPHLVTCWALAGYGRKIPVAELAAALEPVNIIDSGHGARHELGEPSLAAPSLAWLQRALDMLDPNRMDRGEWISFTAAFKQAGWTLAQPETLFEMWSAWCDRYEENDTGENLKQWNSIRNTELGWASISRRPELMFQHTIQAAGLAAAASGAPAHVNGHAVLPAADATAVPPVPPMPEPAPLDCSGEFLSHIEQAEWFKGCIFVERFGQILAPSGRLMNATTFNAKYGGKRFLIDSVGKPTDEAWKAATRSTLWRVPQVDHTRFLPMAKPGDIIVDALGRKGLNTYKPAIIVTREGDVTPFVRHMTTVLPNENDRNTYLYFLAHNAKYPGHKIPWAPLIQSAEGVGKGVLKRLISHMMGGPYVYFPNAKEMVASGSKFNAWMRNRLFILCDEIKVDERRDMIEVLKPMISETEIEVQGKGQDQDKEDNYANWAFFSNHKDAIPVDKNARRFAIFYSPLQTANDIEHAGMNQLYFDRLYAWLDAEGAAMVTHWLMRFPIERGSLPMRAPETSSTAEAQRVSRGPIETAIMNAVADQMPGFRGGWVSTIALANRLKAIGINKASANTLARILESLGYHFIGRAPRSHGQETPGNPIEKADLWYLLPDGNPELFGKLQGYE